MEAYFIMETRKCSKCKEIKSLDFFFKNKAMKGGSDWWCKPCKREKGIKLMEEKRQKQSIDRVQTKPYNVTLLNVLPKYSSLDNYGIDEEAFMWSFIRGQWKRMALSYDTKGYQCFKYRIDKKGYTDRVHRIMAMLWIENPDKKCTVNHKDGNRKNNTLSNLEWATQSENIKHSYDELGHSRLQGTKNPKAKLDDDKVREIRKLCNNGLSQRSVAKIMNICHSIVRGIMNGNRWAHVV